jgi:hypothetical protein
MPNRVRQFVTMHTMRHYLFFLIYHYFSLLADFLGGVREGVIPQMQAG